MAQSEKLKKLNLMQCPKHARLFSAKPGGFCYICGPETANPAPAEVIESARAILATQCKHGIEVNSLGYATDCKKCVKAAKERQRRASKKVAA